MNDYVMAIACTKDTEHADRACFLNPGNGTDGFYVSLSPLQRPFQVISKNTGVLFLFILGRGIAYCRHRRTLCVVLVLLFHEDRNSYHNLHPEPTIWGFSIYVCNNHLFMLPRLFASWVYLIPANIG